MIIVRKNTNIISQFPICDIEIANDIRNMDGGDWFYELSDIITVGLLVNNEITIIQREKTDDKEQFIKTIKEFLPNKFYSFNLNMEKKGLKGFCNIDYEVLEIKVWKAKYWNKDKFYEEVKSITTINDVLNDSLNGDGGLCIPKYAEEKYDEIISHNTCCLIKEAYILNFRKELLEKFKSRINSQGWLV